MQYLVSVSSSAGHLLFHNSSHKTILDRAVLCIRPAVKSDSKCIAAVHYQSIQANFATSKNKQLTNRGRHQLEGLWASKFKCSSQIAVLECNGLIVGFASVDDFHDEINHESAGQICSLYVHPCCWGKGYGHLLIKWCELALALRGYASCQLWVEDINVRARRFYEKQGFIIDGVVKEENGVTLCRMQKQLLEQAA